MSIEERLDPNYDKLDVALRSIGYNFDVAVADVIDNSVDAQAENVLVRLITGGDGHIDLAIADDGHGMSALTLKEAMRFGADVSSEIERRLGKFGLGLKLASLSQARELTVVTTEGGKPSGRAWLETGIAKGFSSTVLSDQESLDVLRRTIPDRPIRKAGTLVWWSRLYRVGVPIPTPQAHAQKLMRRLEQHLSLAFHRFLAGSPRKVNISLDIFDRTRRTAGIPIPLDPLNPFGYPHSGRSGFPTTMKVDGNYKDLLNVRAHIWPANSQLAEYKLPGGANTRQGFYFYRNDRLIQGGGWHGLRETEPHSSLARVEVDLAADFDLVVSLDVKKVEIQLPPDLLEAIQASRATSGSDFKKYLSLADETYRHRRITESELPLIPSSGLPADLASFLHEELRLNQTSKYRKLQIQWTTLGPDEVFAIDRDEARLLLNKSFRRKILHGFAGSTADAPVFKCLLFFVLRDALASERMSGKLKEAVDQVNRVLFQALKFERSE